MTPLFASKFVEWWPCHLQVNGRSLLSAAEQDFDMWSGIWQVCQIINYLSSNVGLKKGRHQLQPRQYSCRIWQFFVEYGPCPRWNSTSWYTVNKYSQTIFVSHLTNGEVSIAFNSLWSMDGHMRVLSQIQGLEQHQQQLKKVWQQIKIRKSCRISTISYNRKVSVMSIDLLHEHRRTSMLCHPHH